MKIDSLRHLFTHELCDTLSAEKQIIQAMLEIIRKAGSSELKDSLQEHLDVTKEQVTKLESIFELIGKAPESIKCKGMEGILEEGSEIIEEAEGPEVLNAVIIAAAGLSSSC